MKLNLIFLAGATAIQSQNKLRHTHAHVNSEAQSALADPLTKQRIVVREDVFDQVLDHFDESNTDTLKQRYFRRQFAAGSDEDSPRYALLCCGGEGPPLTKSVLTNSVHCTGDMLEFAASLPENSRVDFYALEHRYYGTSFPDDSVMDGSDKWKYLSSRQAINDVAAFIVGTDSEATWVTFGGSYPGMVAGFSRSKFPDVISASVSNSAPMQAQVEMKEYNDVVARDLADADVGGSKECHDIVSNGHDAIRRILESDSTRDILNLAEQFNFCDPESLLEVNTRHSFAGDGVIYIMAQENDPSCTTEVCDISKLCEFLIAAEGKDGDDDDLNKLAALASLQNGGECVRVNADSDFEYYSSNAAVVSGAASWLYQTCNEFGFYQTCTSDSSCPYAKGFHTLDRDLDLCEKVFNITADEVYANVDASNEFYGGWGIVDPKIIFVNGDVDPWSALAVTEGNPAVSEENFAFWVEGASHHFWTHESLPTDKENVNQAREKIWAKLTDFLTSSSSSSSSSSHDFHRDQFLFEG